MHHKKAFCLPTLLFIAVLQLFFQAEGKEIILFAPHDQPEKHLISYLDQAQKQIYAAVYVLTNKAITKALMRAKKRNVDVQIIVDAATLDHKTHTIEQLKEAEIDIFVYPSTPHHAVNKQQPTHKGIMHHKFALIDNSLWTGSFNWTTSANKYNKENVIISDDISTCTRYKEEFNALKIESINPKRKNKVSHGGNRKKQNRVSFFKSPLQAIKAYFRRTSRPRSND